MYRQKVPLITAIFIMFLAACSSSNGGGGGWLPPSGQVTPVELWSRASLVEPGEQGIQLAQQSGDLVLQGAESVLALLAVPEERQLLAVDRVLHTVRLTLLDLNRLETYPVGDIVLEGAEPAVAGYHYPWLLFQASNSDGMFHWLLVDISEWEQVWEHSAWVPEGLRQKPVWYHDGNWLLGPVSGPRITDVPHSSRPIDQLEYAPLNPLTRTWPGWAGPAGPWFAYPAKHQEEEKIALINVDTNFQLLLPAGQQLRWDSQAGALAWIVEEQLVVVRPGEQALEPMGDQPVCAPLWSGQSQHLYFVAGRRDYFGVTWDRLWSWQEGEKPVPEYDLPPVLGRWRLLAAADEAVLAAAGDVLVYFDLVERCHWELGAVEPGNWLWAEANLFVVNDGELLRISPGGSRRLLQQFEHPVRLLSLVDNYLAYQVEDQVLLKQVILQGH